MIKVVIIFGDRYWTNYNAVLNIVKRLKDKYKEIKIVEGECPYGGADECARRAANECEVPHAGYPAQWKKYGKAAGPKRNQQMIDEEKPEICIAFHSDIENSKGTKDMITRAKDQGIETYVITK